LATEDAVDRDLHRERRQDNRAVRWSPYEATQKERGTFEAGRDLMNAGWTGTFERLDAYLGQA
jgi:hypothetical protein